MKIVLTHSVLILKIHWLTLFNHDCGNDDQDLILCLSIVPSIPVQHWDSGITQTIAHTKTLLPLSPSPIFKHAECIWAFGVIFGSSLLQRHIKDHMLLSAIALHELFVTEGIDCWLLISMSCRVKIILLFHDLHQCGNGLAVRQRLFSCSWKHSTESHPVKATTCEQVSWWHIADSQSGVILDLPCRQCPYPAEFGSAAEDGSHLDEHLHGHLQWCRSKQGMHAMQPQHYINCPFTPELLKTPIVEALPLVPSDSPLNNAMFLFVLFQSARSQGTPKLCFVSQERLMDQCCCSTL